jgi:hypothetical protein
MFCGVVRLQRMLGTYAVVRFKKRCIKHEEFAYIAEDLHKKLENDDLEFLAVVARNLIGTATKCSDP